MLGSVYLVYLGIRLLVYRRQSIAHYRDAAYDTRRPPSAARPLTDPHMA